VISTLIALPYEIARLPIVIVDSAVIDRLPDTSAPRVTLDRAIGSADKLAGTLLGNRDIARRGAERIERSERLQTVGRLEQEAEARRGEACGKKQAKAKAAKTASAKKSAADKRAAGRTAAVAERKARVDTAVSSRKQAAQRKAKAELDDVRETKQSAAEARADAERLSDLAETKKQKRKQD
jgi:hypothetical protein